MILCRDSFPNYPPLDPPYPLTQISCFRWLIRRVFRHLNPTPPVSESISEAPMASGVLHVGRTRGQLPVLLLPQRPLPERGQLQVLLQVHRRCSNPEMVSAWPEIRCYVYVVYLSVQNGLCRYTVNILKYLWFYHLWEWLQGRFYLLWPPRNLTIICPLQMLFPYL